MDQKETNHRVRVHRAARDGVNRMIARQAFYRHSGWENRAGVLADNADEIASIVIEAIRENYTIRPRVRK